MKVRSFGRVGEAEILEVKLATDAGAEARIITWGAVLRDLLIPGRAGMQRVVLGFEQLGHYLDHSPYFGAVVGRHANRIGGARFRLGGREVRLVPNEGSNQLHGGPAGFGVRPWSLLGYDGRRAYLGLVSDDGDMGYPGRLFATCTYELLEPATVRVTLEASCDAPTPVNLTTHSYYNLDGSPDIRDHRLAILADHITPTDGALIPTGEMTPVAGTRFDFREPRAIRQDGPYQNYDTNFVLRREHDRASGLAHAATLSSDRNGVSMELWTTEPGLQFYDGHLIDIPVRGNGGMPLRPHAGLPLEPQRFPDGPNHAHFPPCILHPGEVSRQTSETRFWVAA